MKMKRFLCSMLALVVASCAFATAKNSDVTRYRHISAITLPEPTQDEELAQVLLTPEMFSVTQDNYADIRVVRRDTGQMVPCRVECVTQEKEETERVTEALEVVTVTEMPDGQLGVTLVRQPERRHVPLAGLTVKTPLRDFERHVQVEVSADGTAWETVVARARVFDVSSFADLRMADIRLPPVSQPHIRLTFNKHDQQTSAVTEVRTTADAQGEISNIDRSFREEQRPFRIDKVDGWTERTRWMSDARPLRTRGDDDHVRITKIDTPRNKRDPQPGLPEDATWLFLDANRVPLEALTIKTGQRFVKIPYELFMETTQPDGKIFWKRITKGVLERVAFRDYLSERMTIAWHTTRANRYCICITAPEDTDLRLIVEAKGPDYRVVFPYAKGDEMDLILGNPEAKTAGHYADQIKILMRTVTKPLTAQPGPLTQNPAWNDKPEANVDMRLILSATIVLVVIVLGFALVTATRRLSSNEDENEQPPC